MSEHSGPETESRYAAQQHPDRQPGKVYLVGAGPGDPELLTLKAARLLGEAQAVVFDHLVGEGVLKLVNPSARRVYAGKEAGNHALPQEEINRLLVDLAREGLMVVRLKGGDPFIFGRGGEEMEELLSCGIACEVVPGITAASGISACTGMPLTHREHARTVVFTTGHLKDDTVNLDWPALVRPAQTVVIYMGLGALDIISRELIAHGMPEDTPAAAIHAGTTPRQVTLTSTLRDLPALVRKERLKSPALIMVGSVVSLRELLGHGPAVVRQVIEV
ncbi:MAG: uroporphyrinogen-III C-methyltransferase [Rhodocyclaceae bacterium]|jgi:uroporphyrin-III C-methyltransferase|nr:uroporphyrinogen-III C-methyltransferase [Rhodocyclaceae bacterium]MCL4757047.1 uroporphyrinogen-III C-methyltransferase [Rhodocyclaceae bacterium]